MLYELPITEQKILQNSYQHLKDIEIKNVTCPYNFRVNDYPRIKTQERLRVELPGGGAVAALTNLGWVILLPGKGNVTTNILFTKTSLHDYENLCSLDCLSIDRNMRKMASLFMEDSDQLSSEA